MLFMLVIAFGAYAKPDPNIEQWDNVVTEACAGDQQCKAVVKAFMSAESGGNDKVVSWGGCVGLMQLCYGTAYTGSLSNIFSKDNRMDCCSGISKCNTDRNNCKDAGYIDPRFDPKSNILAGTRLIMSNLKRYNGNLVLMTIAYNAGPGIASSIIERLGDRPATVENVLTEVGPAIRSHSAYSKWSQSKIEQKIKNIPNYAKKILRAYVDYGGDASKLQGSAFVDVNIDNSAPAYSSSNALSVPLGKLGTYTVRPAIKAKVKYDQTEYQRLKILVQTLIQACSSKANSYACVLQQTSAFSKTSEFQWSVGGCDEGTEKISSDFAEQLTDCIGSSDDSCVCDISVKSDQYMPGTGYSLSLMMDVDEGLNPGSSGVQLIDQDGNDLMSANEKKLIMISSAGEKKVLDRVNLNFFIKDIVVSGGSSIAYLSGENTDKGGQSISGYSFPHDSIRIKKQGDELVFSNDGFKSERDCNIEKRTYRFCAVSKNHELYAYDEGDQMTKKRNITYRFALSFFDDPPPIVTGVMASDAKSAENSMIIMWDRSPDDDVTEYILYYSDTSKASDAKVNDLKYLENNFKKKVIVLGSDQIIVDSGFDISSDTSCAFDQNKKICDYQYSLSDGTKISFVKDKIHYLKPSGKYLYVLSGLSDSNQYTLAVVAKDKAGNMKKDPKEYLFTETTPKDGLAPGFVDFITNKVNKVWFLDVKKPTMNIDGTQLTNILRYNIYYSQSAFDDASKVPQLGSLAANLNTFQITLPIGSYYFAVTSVDNLNNEFKGVGSKQIVLN